MKLALLLGCLECLPVGAFLIIGLVTHWSHDGIWMGLELYLLLTVAVLEICWRASGLPFRDFWRELNKPGTSRRSKVQAVSAPPPLLPLPDRESAE